MGKNTLVAQTMIAGVRRGEEDKEKRRRRRRCVWLLGEQLVSRLANINMFVLEFGVFCAVGDIFYPIRQGLFVSLFPLISVINVPFIGSECGIAV